MRTYAAALFLVVLLPVAAWATCTGSQPTLCLSLNQNTFQAGQTMNLSASVTPGPTPPPVDVYIALQLPTGTLLFLQGNGSFTTNLTPFASGWTPSAIPSALIFSYTFGGSEPAGAYHWLAAFTQPGTLNFIGGIADTPFTANLSGTYDITGNVAIGGCFNANFPITGDLTIALTGGNFTGLAHLSSTGLSLTLNLTGTVDGTSVNGS